MTSTGPTAATRELVLARDHDSCRRCGRRGEQIHHRKPRGMGGTSDPAINEPQNLVLVCQPCHAWIEQFRRLAYELGWLVARAKQPESTPLVSYIRQTMTMLLTDGTAVEDRLLPLPDTEMMWTATDVESA